MITYIVKPNNILNSFFKTLHLCMPFKISRQTWKNQLKLGQKMGCNIKTFFGNLKATPPPILNLNVFEWRGIDGKLI